MLSQIKKWNEQFDNLIVFKKSYYWKIRIKLKNKYNKKRKNQSR